MPIRRRMIESGNLFEVEIFPISDRERKQSREKKNQLTVPAQKNLNDTNSKKNFLRLMEANFTTKDLVIHLTYADKHLPLTIEQAKKDMRNFIRAVRRRWDKKGMGEFKYLAVREGGEVKEDGSVARMHFHIVLTGGLDRDVMESLWKYGYVNSRRLQTSDKGLEKLANYLTKSVKKGEKKYIPSKNLQKPNVSSNDWGHGYTKGKVEKIAKFGADDSIFWEQKYPGYFFVSCESRESDWTGTSLYIKMRKLQV